MSAVNIGGALELETFHRLAFQLLKAFQLRSEYVSSLIRAVRVLNISPSLSQLWRCDSTLLESALCPLSERFGGQDWDAATTTPTYAIWPGPLIALPAAPTPLNLSH